MAPAALDTLAQLKTREEPVALIISDQRMPGMTGVEMLERARDIYPDARRILLTAYADTEAAIRAINTARIHYYLNKPWDPPEEKLYPPSSTTCSTIGRLASCRPSRGCASSGTAGRSTITACATSSREITFPIAGSMSPPAMKGSISSRSASSIPRRFPSSSYPTVPSSSIPISKLLLAASDSVSRPHRISMTSSSSVLVQPASPPPSTAQVRASAPS
ncbi:MAG: response regulator [Terracidiphilus sp.]